MSYVESNGRMIVNDENSQDLL